MIERRRRLWAVLAVLAFLLPGTPSRADPPKTTPAGVQLVGSSTYSIPASDPSSEKVDVRIPYRLSPGAADITTLEVLRATTPAGADARASFALIKPSDRSGDILAHVQLKTIPWPGSYALRVLTRHAGGADELLDLTLMRPAPMLEPSTLAFQCVDLFSGCELTPSTLQIAESSKTAGAANIQVFFKTPLRVKESNAIVSLKVGALQELRAGAMAEAPLSLSSELPLGTTAGVATIRSDQTNDIVVPIEIQHRRSAFWLAFTLGVGLILGFIRRRILVPNAERRAAYEAAGLVVRSIRERAARVGDAVVGNDLSGIADKLTRELASTKTKEQIALLASSFKALADASLAEATKARTDAYQARTALVEVLSCAPSLPADLRRKATALQDRVQGQLRVIDTTPIARLALQQQMNADDLRALADASKQWIASMAEIQLGPWELLPIRQVRGELLPELQRFAPEADDASVVRAAARLAEKVRHQILRMCCPAAIDASRRGMTELIARRNRKLEPSLRILQSAIEALAPYQAADAIEARAAATAIEESRRALSAAIEAAASPVIATDLRGALDKGDFDRALGLLGPIDEGAPILEALSDPSNAGGASLRIPEPARAVIDDVKPPATPELPPPPPLPGPIAEYLANGGWAGLIEYALAALTLGAVGFFALESSFVGTPRDFAVAFIWSVGTHVGASTFATARKSFVGASLADSEGKQ